jgi:hypothetical protein
VRILYLPIRLMVLDDGMESRYMHALWIANFSRPSRPRVACSTEMLENDSMN